MEVAVFCTLNNLSYEREAIFKFLTQQRQTPDGIKLPEGVGADSVLVANLALRKVIESHPPPSSSQIQKSRIKEFA